MRCWSPILTLVTLIFSSDAQYLTFPLTKQSGLSNSLNKRTIANGSLQLNAQQNAYTANISFGTPAQTVQLVVDTGSPLTWVNAKNVSTFTPGSTPTSAQAAQGSTICATYSCFSESQSSSLTIPSSSNIFLIEYVDGTESVGQIVQDRMVFQGLADSTFDFGVVEYFYSPNGAQAAIGGILGLSPPNAVASFSSFKNALSAASVTTSFTPQTILQQLQAAGAITSTAFSMYLSDGTDGELTLGGVDSGRYTGPLTVVPIADADTSYGGVDYYVNLDSVGYGGNASSKIPVSQPVVLDSGTTATYIPIAAAEALAQAMEGSFIPYDSASGLVAVPCTPATTIDFYFDNSAVIRVPISAIIDSQLTVAQAERLGITTDGTLCVLALFGTSSSTSYLLGDSFLRSAYVVYDVDASSIALAQSFYGGASNVTAIGSGSFGIPDGVYNSSSSGASDVAVVPSLTRTVSLAATGIPETTSLLRTSGTSTSTTSTSTSTSTSTGSAQRFTITITPVCTILASLITIFAGCSII